jgi:hypothetical protein
MAVKQGFGIDSVIDLKTQLPPVMIGKMDIAKRQATGGPCRTAREKW